MRFTCLSSHGPQVDVKWTLEMLFRQRNHTNSFADIILHVIAFRGCTNNRWKGDLFMIFIYAWNLIWPAWLLCKRMSKNMLKWWVRQNMKWISVLKTDLTVCCLWRFYVICSVKASCWRCFYFKDGNGGAFILQSILACMSSLARVL